MKIFSKAIGSGLIVTTLLAGHVFAQEQEQATLEEVVVTARKREERLQEIPGSAAALTSDFLEDIGGIQSLRDLTDQIPGVTITESQDPNLSEPSIRGAGQSRNRMSVSATGIYRNGAYIADKGIAGRNFARFDTFDLERAEVLRGPQGALYGRNALGGAINLISKRPENFFNTELSVLVGENERTQFEGIVNVPLTDQLFSRFSYVVDDYDDGFYEDANGDPLDDNHYEHARASLRHLSLNDALEINYVYDFMDEEYPPRISINRRPDIRAARNNDPFQTLINTTNRTFNEVDNHSLQIDYTGEAGTFTSITNLRMRDVEVIRDPDHNDNTLAQATRMNTNRNLTEADTLFQEFRFAAAPRGPITWMVGADYYATETDQSIVVTFPSLAGTTQAFFGEPTGLVYDSLINIDQDSWSVYGSLDYTLESMPLTLSGEVRYAVDEVDGSVVIFRPFQGCSEDAGQAPCTDIVSGDKYTNTPWTVTASWKVQKLPNAMDDALVYGKVGSTYRHGGLNLAEGLPSDRFPVKLSYDEETALTYEVGLKTAWFGNRMRFNMAAFHITYEDFLDTTTNGCPELCTLLDPDTFEPLGFNPDGSRVETDEDGEPGVESGTAFFIDNVGEVEAWGIEYELTAKSNLDKGVFRASLAYSRQLGEVTDIAADVAPQNQQLEGERLNRMRPHQWKGNLRYTYPLPGSGWFSGASLVAVATIVNEKGGFRNLNTDAVPLDNFTRVDARLGVRTDRWSIFLTGGNITDEDYVLWQNSVEPDSGRYRLSDPRYYALEFTWHYR